MKNVKLRDDVEERARVRAADLTIATACLHEAALRIAQALGHRGSDPSWPSLADYAEAVRFFRRAHARYTAVVADCAGALGEVGKPSELGTEDSTHRVAVQDRRAGSTK